MDVLGRPGEELEGGSLHLLPCCIAHNGPADVSSYFIPKNTGADSDDIEVKEAAFRGRKLLGSTLQLPQNYSGFVLEKRGDAWAPKSQFHDITYWNHDTMPTNADSLRRCIDWLHISAAMHRPVTAAEVAIAVQEQGAAATTAAGKRKPA